MTYKVGLERRAGGLCRSGRLLAIALAVASCADDEKPSAGTVGTMQDADAGSDGAVDVPMTDPLEVTVAEGALRGASVGGARAFLSIPYAKPPVGERRFMPPEPAEPWTGTRDATLPAPSCMQKPGSLAGPAPYAEDCLFLNIYAPPSARSDDKHPVLVWIHGGAYVAGGSTTMTYHGAQLARERSVVVVTLNYRLNAFGFLSHPALDAARGGVPSGNDGLRDQQMALRWVQRNIEAFGGDPRNVTLIGESAGASSACVHMLSPSSRGLAARYVTESGSCTGGLPLATKERANAVGMRFGDAFCADAPDLVGCLRAADPMQLATWGASNGITGAGWMPVINPADEIFPAPARELIDRADFQPQPLLTGTNKSEWELFTFANISAAVSSVATLTSALEVEIGVEIAARVQEHYARYDLTDANASAIWSRIMTDATFRCPARTLARKVSARGGRVHLYSFEHGLAWHAFEIPYVFGNPAPVLQAATLEPGVLAAMQSYWVQFARTGDPNGGGQPSWPAYTSDSDQHMTLDAMPRVGTGLAKDDCDFWDTLNLPGSLAR